MDLREARVGKRRAMLVRAPDGRAVRSFRVRGKKVDVAVAPCGENHRVGRVRFYPAAHQVARHNAARVAVHHHQIQHLRAREHLHASGIHLPLQRLICSQQQLLAGLAPRVERPRNLRAAERPVGQRASIFARERNALRHALIDNIHADLRQAIDVRLARPEIAAL